MKCIKCHQELREGAKFCTICGAKQILQAEASCNHHTNNKPVSENISQVSNTQTNSIQQTRNYLFWHIQPGEIARIINESEFLNYNSARGIIINKGTIAQIYAHGTLITTLQGGKYDFVSSQELDEALDNNFGGISGAFQGFKRVLARLIYGQNARERIKAGNNTDLQYANQLNQVIQHLNRNNLFSVVLLQERDFELIFGDSVDTQRTYSDFRPMSVQTPHLNIQIGLSATFRISDIERFIQYYLAERKFVTTELLAKALAPHIENAIRKCIGNINIESTDITHINNAIQSYSQQIEDELRQMSMNGLSLQRVLRISCNNEDIERFRQLSHELYVSEEELNYLNKTNEFKNRLATTVNQQHLHEARTELDLMRCLQEINKDRKISDEELERFYIVLSRERRIFEAQSTETENKALNEILKTGLLREEELAMLKQEAELRKIERENKLSLTRQSGDSELRNASYRNEFALKLMQLRDSIEYEKVRTGGEAEINITQLANELEIISRKDAYKDHRFGVELEQQRQRDEYAWQQRQREQDFSNHQTELNFKLAQQAMASQMERYKALSEIDSEEEDRASKRRIAEESARNEHERLMHSMDVDERREHNRLRAGMTAEQIAAEQLFQLDKDAQVAYFNAGKNSEMEREFYLRQQQLHEEQLRREEMRNRETQQQISNMFQQAMNTVATMSNNMVENRNEQRREYRDELHREQERHDAHQDRALNYTTRIHTSSQPVNNKPQIVVTQQPSEMQPAPSVSPAAKNIAQSDVKICPQCNKQFPLVEKFCDECGHELEA